MKILQFIFTGLGTNPVDPQPNDPEAVAFDCGMLETALHIRNEILPTCQHVIETVGWNEYGSPNARCQYILDFIQRVKPDRIIVHAHSFGNTLLCFLTQWLAKWYPQLNIKIDLAFGYDPCRVVFPAVYGVLDWKLSPVVAECHSWFNTDWTRCWGVHGTPFVGWDNQTDVTDWVPKLAHVTEGEFVGIPQSDVIRKLVYAVVAKVAA